MNDEPTRTPLVVIGGSAGALDPLRRLISTIPSDFPAAIFVVNHVPAASISALPHLLSRSGELFATHAIDGAPIAASRIIVAPPDHHLMIQDGVMRVVQGPMENNHRPSIDVLFRSAATNFDSAACGVLLSGALDDGVAGMVAIHEAGGATFVQEPDDAQFPDMPLNALATGAVDGAYRAEELYEAIRRWLSSPRRRQARGLSQDERETGRPSVFTCPDCGGTLWEAEGAVLRFRCRTGHAYSGHSMLASQETKVEEALWVSLRALEERRDLLRRVARRSRLNGESAASRRFEVQAGEVEADMQRVRDALQSITAEASPA